VKARLTVLVVALVVVGCAAPTGAAVRSVYLRTAIVGGRLAVEPEEIAISVHGSLSLHEVHYEIYGGRVAKATARARVRGCVPDCNLGGLAWPAARVRLSDLVRCDGRLVYGRLVYGRLGYALRGALPEGSCGAGGSICDPRPAEST
jgi:hypothetical protein